jgi:hypothetical protein
VSGVAPYLSRFLISLYLLQKYGNEWRPAAFYSDCFLRAFPMVLAEVRPLPHETPEDEAGRCYTLRSLERFAQFLGLAVFECEPPYPADLTYDSDGSAKAALIAMDRSIAAWWRMRGQFPGLNRAILKYLVLLAQLKDATEHVFVNARGFVRPGFDEGSL